MMFQKLKLLAHFALLLKKIARLFSKKKPLAKNASAAVVVVDVQEENVMIEVANHQNDAPVAAEALVEVEAKVAVAEALALGVKGAALVAGSVQLEVNIIKLFTASKLRNTIR